MRVKEEEEGKEGEEERGGRERRRRERVVRLSILHTKKFCRRITKQKN